MVAQYASKTFALGVERFEAAPGETVPAYNAARSVVDAMRHRSRIGETLTLSALGRYLRQSGRGAVTELPHIARELDALSNASAKLAPTKARPIALSSSLHAVTFVGRAGRHGGSVAPQGTARLRCGSLPTRGAVRMTSRVTRGPMSMSSARIRFVVVDDHNLFRTGLVSLLTSVPTFVVEAEGSTGAEAVVLCRLLRPDVLIIDIEMPGSDPHEVLIDILKDSPDTKVIILSMHDDGAQIRELLAVGVSGFLHKSIDYPALRTAIDSVLMNSDQLVIHLPQKSLLADDRAEAKPSGLISARELEVLSMLAKGMSNAELARRLFISVSTVKRHLTNIYRKLGAVSRVDALRRAEAAGMLPARHPDERSPTSGSPLPPWQGRSRPPDRWRETS
ncbi:response regulator transcription factor [Streptomyces sp. NPDC048415]|uniref:response regulator transcription factor n=1 Tax=Streptomyces sp. NPDC048415 TaxID=3154822 RepID=UPI0034326713